MSLLLPHSFECLSYFMPPQIDSRRQFIPSAQPTRTLIKTFSPRHSWSVFSSIECHFVCIFVRVQSADTRVKSASGKWTAWERLANRTVYSMTLCIVSTSNALATKKMRYHVFYGIVVKNKSSTAIQDDSHGSGSFSSTETRKVLTALDGKRNFYEHSLACFPPRRSQKVGCKA